MLQNPVILHQNTPPPAQTSSNSLPAYANDDNVSSPISVSGTGVTRNVQTTHTREPTPVQNNITQVG